MRKYLCLILFLPLMLSACRVRLQSAQPTTAADKMQQRESSQFGNTNSNAENPDSAEKTSDDENLKEFHAEDGKTVENPDASRKEYDENAAAEITGRTDRLIHREGEGSGSFAENIDSDLSVSKLKENAEETALLTAAAEEAEETGISEDGEAAESILEYYTVLLQDRGRSLFECKRQHVYWETSADHMTVYKTSPEHRIILNAGAYDVSSRLLAENLEVDDSWVVRKNPGVIVKVVPENVLGSSVMSTEAADAVRTELLTRPGWNGIDAVRQERVILLSEEILTAPYLQVAAMLAVAKTAVPDLYADVEVEEALSQLIIESTGEKPTGIFIY